mmetsp:Transcript_50120/g.130514  ORF Transcript_50120/g.130514 Transcript_50120/m.130514 type:complete len:263 (+) Transcript_50120:458-1246(+)
MAEERAAGWIAAWEEACAATRAKLACELARAAACAAACAVATCVAACAAACAAVIATGTAMAAASIAVATMTTATMTAATMGTTLVAEARGTTRLMTGGMRWVDAIPAAASMTTRNTVAATEAATAGEASVPRNMGSVLTSKRIATRGAAATVVAMRKSRTAAMIGVSMTTMVAAEDMRTTIAMESAMASAMVIATVSATVGVTTIVAATMPATKSLIAALDLPGGIEVALECTPREPSIAHCVLEPYLLVRRCSCLCTSRE